VIKVKILAKIRRLHRREGQSVRQIFRDTGLSRNTVRNWLRQDAAEPEFHKRKATSVVDRWADQLRQWLQADSHRTKRERRTLLAMHKAIVAQGYPS
jgi:transposase